MSSDNDDPKPLYTPKSSPMARSNLARSSSSEPPAKRRRLSADVEAIVESSDVGEMEQLAAEGDDYWQSQTYLTDRPADRTSREESFETSRSQAAPLDLPPSSPASTVSRRAPSLSRTPIGDRTSSILPTPSDIALPASSPAPSLVTLILQRSPRRDGPPSETPPTEVSVGAADLSAPSHAVVPEANRFAPIRELRPRTKKQLAPFTMDRVEYERTLRNAREAIVRDRLIARRREESQYEEVEETGTSLEVGESQDDAFVPPPSPPRRRARSRSAEHEQPSKRTKQHPDPVPLAPTVTEEEIFARFGGVISDSDEGDLHLPRIPIKKKISERPARPRRPAPFPLPLDENQSDTSMPRTRRRGSLASIKCPEVTHLEAQSTSTLRPSESPNLHGDDDASITPDRSGSHSRRRRARTEEPAATFSPGSSHSATQSEHASDDSSDDSTDSVYLLDKDYKKMKALSRMQPWFLVKRALEGRKSPRTQARTQAQAAIDRTPTPEPLPPSAQDNLDSWIRYDDGDNIQPTEHPRVFQGHEEGEGAVEISDDDQDDGLESSTSDSDIQFVSATRRSPGPRMERDLIDRMISRPTYMTKRHRPAKAAKRRVKRAAEGHQTRLRFPVVGRTRHDEEDAGSYRKLGVGGEDSMLEDAARRRRRRRHFGGSLEDDDLIFRKDIILGRTRPAQSGPLGKPSGANGAGPRGERRAHHFERSRSSNYIIQPGPLPQPANTSIVEPIRTPTPSGWDLYATFSLDFGIQALAPGIKASPTSYLGKGRLYELLSLLDGTNVVEAQPRSFDELGLTLVAHVDYPTFENELPAICDALHDWVRDLSNQDKEPAGKDLMRYVAVTITRLIPRQTTENAEQACGEIGRQLQHLMRRFSVEVTGESPGIRFLQLQWHVLEICVRMCAALQSFNAVETPQIRKLLETINDAVKSLLGSLLKRGIHQAMKPIKQLHGSGNTTIDDPVAELWICMMHLTRKLSTRYASILPFTRQLEDAIAVQYPQAIDVHACEQIWYAAMAVCSLSQFTSSGVTVSEPEQQAHWPLVLLALSHVHLASALPQEYVLSNVAATNRDKHIRIILRRCCLMVTRWHWDLSSAEPLLKVLNDFFKIRKFSNLDTKEERKPDFAPFLTNFNAGLLSALETPEPAYGMFLKLLAGMVDALRNQGAEKRITKLLGVFIPVGVVTFTKEKPPTRFELSQLYNRYSAVLLALYLEPSSATRRIESARRILDFAKADQNSRQVCLRAVMYLGILLRHLQLDLQPAAQWTGEMMETMLIEFPVVSPQEKAAPLSKIALAARDEAEMMICALLRSITKVIKIPSLSEPTASIPAYPAVVLLRNSWAPKILRSSAYVNSLVAVEVLHYIQAFLDERLKVLPATNSRSNPRKDEESQDYGDADYDFDDPAFLQFLEVTEGTSITAAGFSEAEKDLARLIDKEVSPAVFQFISNVFANGQLLGVGDWATADLAVDCWAACGQVLVANDVRDWSSYANVYGAESYTRLMNKAERRRVGLRLMYKALLLDPRAYERCQEDFLSVWCQTIVRPKLTLELAFTTALLQHPETGHTLLAPLCTESHRLVLDPTDPKMQDSTRMEIINSVLAHAATIVAAPDEEPGCLRYKRITLNVLAAIVPAMKDYYWIYSSVEGPDSRRRYQELCLHILSSMKQYVPQVLVNGDHDWLPPLQQTDIHVVQNESIIQ